MWPSPLHERVQHHGAARRARAALPTKYLAKLKQIQSVAGKHIKYGIGLESHFDEPNIPYMRGSLDTLAVWLTDVAKGPKQVEYLEEVMREGFAHPDVRQGHRAVGRLARLYGGFRLVV
jgi:hypothetical protein